MLHLPSYSFRASPGPQEKQAPEATFSPGNHASGTPIWGDPVTFSSSISSTTETLVPENKPPHPVAQLRREVPSSRDEHRHNQGRRLANEDFPPSTSTSGRVIYRSDFKSLALTPQPFCLRTCVLPESSRARAEAPGTWTALQGSAPRNRPGTAHFHPHSQPTGFYTFNGGDFGVCKVT